MHAPIGARELVCTRAEGIALSSCALAASIWLLMLMAMREAPVSMRGSASMHAHTSVMLEPMSAAWPASSSALVCATANSCCFVS